MTENSKARMTSHCSRHVLLVLAITFIGCVLAWWIAPQQFYIAWLAACLLPWSVSIGSLTFMLVANLTGGRWASAAWPWLAINARLMPLVAFLFVPWLFGISSIYPWANSDILAQFENTENRQWLFQLPFFIGRTIFYFALWSSLAWLATGRRSTAEFVDDCINTFHQSTESRGIQRRLDGVASDAEQMLATPAMQLNPAIAGLGLIAILLTVTWASIDWVMSFDPFFTSTLFGALVGIGAMLASISATVAAVCFWKPLHDASVNETAIADLSNLMLAFLMLWAYFSFAHFLIMWSGNLPIEASFYLNRRTGVWGWIAPILSVAGFIVPFLCLLSSAFKRSPRKVGALAISLLLVRMVELWWIVLPAGQRATYSGLHWSTIPVTVLIVAVYWIGFAWMASETSRLDAPRMDEVRHV